jgi:hypothetical protein
MKQSPFFLLPALALTAANLTACLSDNVTEPPALVPVAADTAYNVFANLPGTTTLTATNVYAFLGANAVDPAPRTFFSLRTGAVVPDSTHQWDVAFRSTGITVNGQAQLVASGFDALTIAPSSGYGASVGTWYNYSGAPAHLITPKADTVIVIRTADNKYAKLQITSYYKGSPASPGASDTSRYYSFRYYLQPDGSTNLRPGTDAAPKTYFSFTTGATVTDSTQPWDIAFRTTTISVRGQAQLLTGVNFDALDEAPETGYAPGNVPAWYDYNLDGNHTITPKVGGVILVKTADNKYAKVQIMSYYQGAPAVPVGTQHAARYYTFRYVYQGNGSRAF